MTARRRNAPAASSTRSALPRRPFRPNCSRALRAKRESSRAKVAPLTAGEMLFRNGDILKTPGVSVLADALSIYGADYDAEPDFEAASQSP